MPHYELTLSGTTALLVAFVLFMAGALSGAAMMDHYGRFIPQPAESAYAPPGPLDPPNYACKSQQRCGFVTPKNGVDGASQAK